MIILEDTCRDNVYRHKTINYSLQVPTLDNTTLDNTTD